MAKKITNTKLRPDGLTDAQRKFVDFYCGEAAGSAGDAYVLAGYSDHMPDQAAWMLLQRPHIQAAIAWKLEHDEGISREFVEKSVALLAGPLNTISSFMQCDEAGKFQSFNFKIAIECGAMGLIKSIALNDEGQIRKIELHDKLAAVTLAARMRGMLNDKLALTGPDGGPIQTENKTVIDAASDPESFELLDRLSQRMVLKPGGTGQSSN